MKKLALTFLGLCAIGLIAQTYTVKQVTVTMTLTPNQHAVWYAMFTNQAMSDFPTNGTFDAWCEERVRRAADSLIKSDEQRFPVVP